MFYSFFLRLFTLVALGLGIDGVLLVMALALVLALGGFLASKGLVGFWGWMWWVGG